MLMNKMMSVVGLALCATLIACGDSIQKDVELPSEKAAARQQNEGLPPGHPPLGGEKIDTHGGQDPQPQGHGHDPFGAADVPPSSGAAGAVAADKVWFKGRVELDPSMKLPATYTIYVNAGLPPQGRPPVLSKRIAGEPKFPLDFELQQKDVAFGATAVDRPLVLYVILSESGFVMANEGVYIKTAMEGPFDPEDKNVVLTLKQP
jgi:hypothetical protein